MSTQTISEVLEIVKCCGFDVVKEIDISTIRLRNEVRDMCKANTCGRYDRCWSCPPACGELADLQREVDQYKAGIIVQTVGEIEDSFDFETMMEIEAEHKNRMIEAADKIRETSADILAIGSGTCTICEKCTWPDRPCRFPKRRMSSLEAFGIVVSDLCTDNEVKYYYGSGKIAYTGCLLV